MHVCVCTNAVYEYGPVLKRGDMRVWEGSLEIFKGKAKHSGVEAVREPQTEVAQS